MLKVLFALLAASSAFAAAPAPTRILALGDSLTEGYGVTREEAYPALVEKLLQAHGKKVVIVNAGVSGSTSASAKSRFQWQARSKPAIMILALGANDGLRGMKLEETKKNLQEVIRLARAQGMRVLLAGMKLPPSYGKQYSEGFEKIFADLAKEEKIPLIPFLLEGVGGNPSLNQPDGMHPNARGHQIVAQTVLKYLEPLL